MYKYAIRLYIDANEIFSVSNNDFDSLKDAVRFFKEVLADK